jgi:Co/Zn/Cd efflux system component
VVVGIILVVVKLVAWILTGSVALLSSAMDAFVDMAASIATFFGVRRAERPPDHDHRFGHGKGEAVAGFTHRCLPVPLSLLPHSPPNSCSFQSQSNSSVLGSALSSPV